MPADDADDWWPILGIDTLDRCCVSRFSAGVQGNRSASDSKEYRSRFAYSLESSVISAGEWITSLKEIEDQSLNDRKNR